MRARAVGCARARSRPKARIIRLFSYFLLICIGNPIVSEILGDLEYMRARAGCARAQPPKGEDNTYFLAFPIDLYGKILYSWRS